MESYRDVAIKRLLSIGIISEYTANAILNAIINTCDYAPQVFKDFAEDVDDDWDNPVRYIK